MDCIVNVDINWAIGTDNHLLFNIPEDMKFFKNTTIDGVIIMGKNTLLSLPDSKPLPNRINIVLSTSLNRNDCIICKNISQLTKQLEKINNKKVFVIGGEQIYRQLLPYCKTAYVTKVFKNGNGTSFFPNLDKSDNWKLIHQGQKYIYNNIEYCFCQYENSNCLIGGYK